MKTMQELITTRRFAYYVPSDGYVEGQGFRVSLVFENESGHYPTGDWPYDGSPGQRAPWFWGPTFADAEAACAEQNARIGLTAEQAFKIVISSMTARKRRSDAGKKRTRKVVPAGTP